MTEQEPKSECCESMVYFNKLYGKALWDGKELPREKYRCSKCHKPCKVKEESGG